MTTSSFVHSVWAVGLLVGFCLIGVAFAAGLGQRRNLLFWRRVKLVSTTLTVIGLVLLLLNFEKTVREMTNPKDYVLNAFIDLKFYLANRIASACGGQPKSEQAKLTCFDVLNIDRQVSFLNLREAKELALITNWQRNPEIDELVAEVNRRVEHINPAIREMGSTTILDPMVRVNLLMLCVLLVIISLAGSIGEAAFQFAQARLQARSS
jgi:cytochrome bd-type quinol oxidase subunit 1